MTLYRIVVDDERTFPFDATYIRNSATAKSWLLAETGHVDELWLDHDLGGSDTTIPVVNLLCDMAFHDTPLDVGVILVHTQNPVGGDTIVRVLSRYGYNVKRAPLPSGDGKGFLPDSWRGLTPTHQSDTMSTMTNHTTTDINDQIDSIYDTLDMLATDPDLSDDNYRHILEALVQRCQDSIDRMNFGGSR